MGLDISVSKGSIGKVVDAADSLDKASTERQLNADELRKILEGAGHLGFNPPALIPHVGIAYGLPLQWEIGVRYAANGWRVGVRHQLIDQETSGFDLAVGFGFGLAAIDPPINTVLDKVDVSDYGRFNIDLPIAIGRHGIWYRWWAGPRFLFSKMSQELTATLPSVLLPNGTVQTNVPVKSKISGTGFYVGASAGVAFGYRWIFIGPELTLVQLVGDADISLFDLTTNVSLDALVVYPSFTLTAEF
jgi:hypothetical protein